jgi:tetratricopeptide (TPR) repeat protein
MPADPPPSLLITPDRRRRLQQQFDEARQLSAQPRPDFRRIHDLLAACVSADPGNILYVDALLANLKRRDGTEAARKSFWWRLRGWLWGGKSTRSSVLSTEYSTLTRTGEILGKRPIEPPLFHQLAAAAGQHDFDEVELRYLAAARELAPDDASTLRLLARALTRQGRFEDAVGPWFAVLALQPGDAEAEQAVDDLRGIDTASAISTHAVENAPRRQADADTLLEDAHASHQAGKLDLAEHYFTQAQAAKGSDLGLLEIRENLRLQKSRQCVEIARMRAAHDPDPKAQSLVSRLEQEHNRLEIDIYNIRAERLPGDWQVRLELARRLKMAGNFSGAIQRLEEAMRLAPSERALLLEQGECWQHLRQYARALEYYEQAIEAGDREGSAGEAQRLARYRAGVLAAAMGQPQVAQAHFRAIADQEPSYKDVAQRLAALA